MDKYTFLCSLVTVMSIAPVSAQVMPDRSVGSQLVPNGSTGNLFIEGGAIRGNNLFHSFQDFNISDGQRIDFVNPTGITNILTRVTGNTASNLFGTLGVTGNANLFLLNPNGITFGTNSRLDVRGAFIATTANAIQFGDQGSFSASNSQVPPLLTINPSALWFNPSAQPIVHRSTEWRTDPGRSLALVGGQVQLEGGQLLAPEGRVELGGLAEQGSVGLQLEQNQWHITFPDQVERANVSLTNDAQVNVRANGRGDIFINAKNFTMTGDETRLLAGIDQGSSNPKTQAGNIRIHATESVSLDASLVDNSVLRNAIGNGGEIQIQAVSLTLVNGAQLKTELFGTGNLRDITVNAVDGILVDERGSKTNVGLISNVNAGARGNSSNITVNARSLTVRNGGRLATTTQGYGNTGNITLNVSDTISVSGLSRVTRNTSGASTTVTQGAIGDAGKLMVNTGALFLGDGASLRTFTQGQGNAGDIVINARDRIVFDGIKPPRGASVGGALSFVGHGAIGNGGDIEITTGSLLIKNGQVIDVISNGAGDAGNIRINARETVEIEGVKEGFPSVVSSSVNKVVTPQAGSDNAAGNGGTITIAAKNVFVTNGAGIEAGIYDAPGQSGNIIINATESVKIAGLDTKSGFQSNLSTDTTDNTSAPGGEIFITANTLEVLDNGLLSANSQSRGRGGTLNLQVNQLRVDTGKIVTTASDQGDAGDISINADQVRLQNAGQISVESQGTGAAGQLKIDARSIVLSDRAQLTAATTNSTGGDITLNLKETLLLRRNSLISATAGTAKAGGDGGNIALRVPFLISVFGENSDIVANAFSGRGGKITITAQNIFGLLARSREDLQTLLGSERLDPSRLLSNDISAISQASPTLSGMVTIDSLDIDPTQSIAELPVNFVDTSQQIDQQLCAISQKSSFVVTGRGGLPDSPTATLRSHAAWEDWRVAEGQPQQVRTQDISASETAKPIIEAQGWVVDANDKVHLTAHSPTTAAPQFRRVQGCESNPFNR